MPTYPMLTLQSPSRRPPAAYPSVPYAALSQFAAPGNLVCGLPRREFRIVFHLACDLGWGPFLPIP